MVRLRRVAAVAAAAAAVAVAAVVVGRLEDVGAGAAVRAGAGGAWNKEGDRERKGLKMVKRRLNLPIKAWKMYKCIKRFVLSAKESPVDSVYQSTSHFLLSMTYF